MTVAIFVYVVLGNGLTPARAVSKFDVLDIDAGVDNVYVSAFSTLRVVFILRERAEG